MIVSLVRFTPGARTNWHSGAVGQTLHVTDGDGDGTTWLEPVTDDEYATADEHKHWRFSLEWLRKRKRPSQSL